MIQQGWKAILTLAQLWIETNPTFDNNSRMHIPVSRQQESVSQILETHLNPTFKRSRPCISFAAHHESQTLSQSLSNQHESQSWQCFSWDLFGIAKKRLYICTMFKAVSLALGICVHMACRSVLVQLLQKCKHQSYGWWSDSASKQRTPGVSRLLANPSMIVWACTVHEFNALSCTKIFLILLSCNV